MAGFEVTLHGRFCTDPRGPDTGFQGNIADVTWTSKRIEQRELADWRSCCLLVEADRLELRTLWDNKS